MSGKVTDILRLRWKNWKNEDFAEDEFTGFTVSNSISPTRQLKNELSQ